MSRSLITRRGFVHTGVAFCAALALVACTETAGDFNPAGPPRARAPGIPVAFVSLQGAPEAVTARLSTAMSQQAARRDITIVGIDGNPRYQLRGYLSAHAAGQGSELGWAFDIFDAQRKRAKRFSGQEILRSDDGWSGVSDQQLDIVAAKALDDIAEFLANAPAAAVATSPATGRGSRAGSVSLIAGN